MGLGGSRYVLVDSSNRDPVVVELENCYIFRTTNEHDDFTGELGLEDAMGKYKVGRLYTNSNGRLALEFIP